MANPRELDVSVVLPYGDDEELIGSAVRRIATHLGSLGLRYEILAVDEDSGDNSHAVLALMRADVPQLRMLSAARRGRGWAVGAAEARGHVLWLLRPAAALQPLAPFGRAFRRVARGLRDLVVVDRRFAVAYRTRTLDAVAAVRGRGVIAQRRLLRRARAHRLTTEVITGTTVPQMAVPNRPWTKFLEVLGSARGAWS